jgi:lysophospholipase
MNTKHIAFTVLSLLSAASSWAVPESKLLNSFNSEIHPYWRSGAEGSFDGVGGISIHYHKFEAKPEKGAIILLPGRAEPAMKYAELVYDLRNSGYSFYLMDLRGQGESDRMTANPQTGYVDSFDDYASDLKTFIAKVVNARPHAKRYIVAHSTGGAAATLYLMQNPSAVNGAAMVAPMYDINLGKLPKPIAYSVVTSAVLAGQGAKYALGKGDWNPNLQLEDDKTTSSAARFAVKQQIARENSQLRTGGPSSRWVQQAIEAETKIRLNGPSLVTTPLLMMEAGDDQIVKTGAQQRFCAKAKHCQEALYEGGMHSLLNDRDPIRNEAIADMLKFFAAN